MFEKVKSIYFSCSEPTVLIWPKYMNVLSAKGEPAKKDVLWILLGNSQTCRNQGDLLEGIDNKNFRA